MDPDNQKNHSKRKFKDVEKTEKQLEQKKKKIFPEKSFSLNLSNCDESNEKSKNKRSYNLLNYFR